MSAIQSVSTALKHFSGKPLSVMSKALGVATLAAVVYDSHINGREKAYVEDENQTADRYLNQYNQFMNMEKESASLAKLKKLYFNAQQNFPLNHIIPKISGYFAGIGNTLFTEFPMVICSAVALKSKGIAGKLSGVILALNAGKLLLYDVFGIGADKNQRKY